MATCLLHPDCEAAATCEYCAQPHCSACLRPLLGRRYCPPCHERVQALALGTAGPGAAASPGGGGAASEERAAPRVPGWVSALIYVLGFLVVHRLAGLALTVALYVSKAASGAFAAGRITSQRDLLDASGIGLPGWSLLFVTFGWATLLLVMAYSALMARWLERRPLLDFGLRWHSTSWRDLFVGIALAAVFFVSVVGVGAGKGWYAVHGVAHALDALAITGVGFLILLPFAAVEEISMRGYLLQAVGRSCGKIAGVLGSTIVFTALHAQNPGFDRHPLAVAGLVLAGLYLASAYLITGNLWLAIFLHAGWNLMEGPIFGLPVSGIEPPASVIRMTESGPDLWTGGTFGPEAGLLLCLLMLVHIAALWAMRPVLAPTPAAETPAPAPDTNVYRAIPVSNQPG